MLGIFVLVVLATTALGAKQKIIPCARGFGTENGCGSCDHSQAITLGSWDNATPSKNIHLEEVGSNTSGGYDIWWSIEQPQRGCRTLLFEPYSTDRGSLNPKLKGNVVLSVAHGGCYFTNLGHRGLLAGTCCNDDCVTAGGKTSSQRKRRSVSPRQWSNSNPFEKPSNNEEAPKPKTTCSKATRRGHSYTKAGAQVVDGALLNCKNNIDCTEGATVSVVSSSSITNSETITHEQGSSVSLSMTAGFEIFPVGPTMEVTTEIAHEWSEAISEGMSISKGEAKATQISKEHNLRGNLKYHGWFTPTLTCYTYKMKCSDGVDLTLEKCDPRFNKDGRPHGESGVMVIG